MLLPYRADFCQLGRDKAPDGHAFCALRQDDPSDSEEVVLLCVKFYKTDASLTRINWVPDGLPILSRVFSPPFASENHRSFFLFCTHRGPRSLTVSPRVVGFPKTYCPYQARRIRLRWQAPPPALRPLFDLSPQALSQTQGFAFLRTLLSKEVGVSG